MTVKAANINSIPTLRFSRYIPFLLELVKRDFKAKYKRSILGVLWSVLQPLMLMVVLIVVFSTLFRFDIENYPLYLISGQVIFNFFNEATTMSLPSIIGGGHIINRVYVPLYMFPLSKVISSLVNVALSMIALIIVVFITGAKPAVTMLLLPIPVLYTFLFSCGIGLLVAAAMVFFRDLAHLYGIITMTLMYLTPIFYPIGIVPDQYLRWLRLNPIFHFVQMFRNIVLYGTFPSVSEHLICFAFCALSLTLGVSFFCRKQRSFILHM